MNLNVRVLPLEILENLVPQKCLLPQHKFPADVRPGSWAKCVLNDGRSFSICQVFPRDFPKEQNCCYMDNICVTSINQNESKGDTTLTLQQLLLLHQSPSVASVKIAFVVTEDLFRQNLKKLTLEYLKNVAQQLLQSLHITVGCSVRIPELTKLGIASVEVLAAQGFDGNSTFSITDDTLLTVNVVQLYSAEETLPHHHFGFEQARQDLQDLLEVSQMMQRQGSLRLSLNALLVGPTGSGKSNLLAHFVKANKCNCFRIIASQVLGQYPGEAEAELRRIFQAARTFERQFKPKYPTIILLEDLHLLCSAIKSASSADNGNSMRLCAQLLSLVDDLYSSGYDIFCLATTSETETLNEITRRPGRFEREIVIATPSADMRKQLFASLFKESFMAQYLEESLTPELLDLVAKHSQGYVVADLALLIRSVGQTLLREKSRDLADVVAESLNKSQPTSIRGTDVSVFKTELGFDSIGGMHQLKRVLEVAVLAGLKQQQAFKRFGLSLPKGVLLYGPPGCAKTTFAKCLATEANMTFIATSGAEVYSPYVGCAEKFIAKIFDTARRNAPCLIFLDEIDSLVGRRALNSSSSGDVQTRILSTLLTEMDGIVGTATADSGKHILVVAATNRPDMVDDALLRPGRFDKLIHIPAPDMESRHSILQLQSKHMPFAEDVNLASIAERTANCSGADICNFCNEAALHAFQSNFDAEEITAHDFETVLRLQKPSLTLKQINWYLEFENKSFR